MLTTSDLLFNRFRLSAFKIQSFAAKHKLHVFVAALYAFARFRIYHLILNAVPVSFNFQMYLDRAVLFEKFSFLKDGMYRKAALGYRCHRPMQQNSLTSDVLNSGSQQLYLPRFRIQVQFLNQISDVFLFCFNSDIVY